MEEFPEQQGGGPVLVRRRLPAPPGLRETLKARLQRSCACSVQGARGLLLDLFPVTRWLCRYSLREDLAGDVMSGLVIGIILVPQAIAYSLLAGLQPIYSLYTSFFANLIYFLMGTSRHVSVGIFSLLCLMVGQVVDRELLLAGFDPAQDGPGPGDNSSTLNASVATLALGLQDCGRDCYAIRVATALTLVAGIYQVRSRVWEVPLSCCGQPPEVLTAYPEGPSPGNHRTKQGTGRGGPEMAPRDRVLEGLRVPRAQGACPASCSLGRDRWLECGLSCRQADWPTGLPRLPVPGGTLGKLPAFRWSLHTGPSPVPGLSTPTPCRPAMGSGSLHRGQCHSWGRRRSCLPVAG